MPYEASFDRRSATKCYQRTSRNYWYEIYVLISQYSNYTNFWCVFFRFFHSFLIWLFDNCDNLIKINLSRERNKKRVNTIKSYLTPLYFPSNISNNRMKNPKSLYKLFEMEYMVFQNRDQKHKLYLKKRAIELSIQSKWSHSFHIRSNCILIIDLFV